MLQPVSRIKVCDNSGALLVSTIRVLGGGNVAKIGHIIIVAVKKAPIKTTGIHKFKKVKVRKGEVRRFLVLRTKKLLMRPHRMSFRFLDNCGIILNKKNEPVATRIFGPVTKELRLQNQMKILSLAPMVI